MKAISSAIFFHYLCLGMLVDAAIFGQNSNIAPLRQAPLIEDDILLPKLHNEHYYSIPSIGIDSSKFSMRLRRKVLRLRAGKTKVKKDGKENSKNGMFSSMKESLSKVQPITRTYIGLVALCTTIHMLGLPAPGLFGLDISKFYEIWRPFTAMSYLGPISMSMANSVYFLLKFGQELEMENGSGAFAWYLLIQTFILSGLGVLVGMPFMAQAMIASVMHVRSRIDPMQQMPFQFGFMITSWQLPFCMMILDCLSQQSLSAAWPHVLGIFAGHVYHFNTQVWPKLGGKARLLPPQWIIDTLGERTGGDNVLTFSKAGADDKKPKAKKSSGLFGKRRAKGRKVGS